MLDPRNTVINGKARFCAEGLVGRGDMRQVTNQQFQMTLVLGRKINRGHTLVQLVRGGGLFEIEWSRTV